MKTKYIIGVIAALLLIATAVVTVESKKLEYMSLAAATESGRTAQISGAWVREKGSDYDPDRNEFKFTMRDSTQTEMPVVLKGAKPNNFEIATSIVVTGVVENGTVQASNILTKCPSKYEADGSELNPNKQAPAKQGKSSSGY